MNYLWEAALESRKAKAGSQPVRYQAAQSYSAYQEMALPALNQTELPENGQVEINPYYRFSNIFKEMYQPDLRECKALRDSLTNMILHLLAESDVRMGMTKEEYEKKLLWNEIQDGTYGKEIEEGAAYFENQERELLLSGCLRMYQTGSSLLIFTELVSKLMANSICYHSNEKPNEILLYTSDRKTTKNEMRMAFLIRMYLDLRYRVEIYYEYHFGILGIADTMILDEMVLQ